MMNHSTTSPAGFEELEQQMRQILQQQAGLQHSILALRDTTASLGETLRQADLQPGLEKLFDLWNMITRSSGELNPCYADLLEQALLLLGAEPIIPKPGDLYDPALHLKQVFSSPSDRIVSCDPCSRGWKFHDVVLRKAVVITDDSGKEELKDDLEN